MKKIILCVLLSVFIFASCSVGNTSPVTDVSNLPFPNINVTESVLTSSEALLLGETYTALNIKTERKQFSNTLAVLPILPTEELNEILNARIAEFLDDLDYPFEPECIDFYCEEALSTRNFTFYVSDTFKLFNEAYFYFSYNLNTNKICMPLDFLEKDTVELYVDSVDDVKDMKVTEGGVFLRTDKDELFVDSDKFRFDKLISVFHPDSYEPVDKNDKKYVALTFDDGPNPYTTSGLVDMLEEKGVKATFFMVGYNIEEYRSTVKKVFDHGHDIGLHSYGHTDYSRMKGEDVISDLDKCSELVYNITGRYPYLVRPPYGSIDMKKIDTDKYFFVNWNVDPLDWKNDSAEKIAKEAIDHTTSGSIILLHDIYQQSCDAAEIIIDTLLEKGYRFVTISEYFDLNGKKTDNKLHFYSGDYNG